MRRPLLAQVFFWCVAAFSSVWCLMMVMQLGRRKDARNCASEQRASPAAAAPQRHHRCAHGRVDPLREISDRMGKQEYGLFTDELVRCLSAPDANQCMVRATIQRQFGQGYSYFENLYYVQESFIFVTSKANSTIDLSAWALFTNDESIRKWGVPGRYASPEDRGFDRIVIDDNPSMSCVSLATEYAAVVPLSQDGRCGPLFGTRCGDQQNPWCNEANGWCGDTEEHRDAQASARYDWRRQTLIQRGNASSYSVLDPSIMITDFLPHYTPHLYHMMENLLGIWAAWCEFIDQRGSGITHASPEWLILPQNSLQSLGTRSARATRGLVRAVFPEIKIIDSRALRSLGQRGAVHFPKLIASDRSAAEHGNINQMITGIRRRLAGLMPHFWAAISRNLELNPSTTRAGQDVVVTFVDRQASGNRGLAPSLARELLWELATLEAGIRVLWLRFELLTLREQVARASATDVLVGVHGNGLTHVLFIRRPGALVEIFPGDGSRILAFQQFSELRGVAYFGLQAASGRVFREGSCDGLSSNASQLLLGSAAPDDCVVEARNINQIIEKLDVQHVVCLVLGAIYESQIGLRAMGSDPRDRCWPRCSAYLDGRRSAAQARRATCVQDYKTFECTDLRPSYTVNEQAQTRPNAECLGGRESWGFCQNGAVLCDTRAGLGWRAILDQYGFPQQTFAFPRARSPPAAKTHGGVSHRLCVLLPFRDGCRRFNRAKVGQRSRHLDMFLRYMAGFLNRTGHTDSSYDFIIINQTERGLFNKGALFNLGANVAFARGCDFVALHDVDHLPTDPRNTYTWPDRPIHLCTNSSDVGWERFAGGAVLIQLAHYVLLNGFSNSYHGWGAEDSDLYERIDRVFGPITRLHPSIGHYEPLAHDADAASQVTAEGATSHLQNIELLQRQKDAKDRSVMDADGYLQMRDHLRVVSTSVAGNVVTVTAHVLVNRQVQPHCSSIVERASSDRVAATEGGP